MRTQQTQLAVNLTLIEVIQLAPQAIVAFDDLGIDYACCGATTLKIAAAGAGLTGAEVIRMISTTPQSEQDWAGASLAELRRHLIADHRRLLSDVIPAVRNAIDAAAADYGQLPLLRRLHELEISLVEFVAGHAASEEQELFPLVEALEAAANSGARPPNARISARVLREALEHEELRDRVHALCDLGHELQADYESPKLVESLHTLQVRLRRHMHLENNVLYPRAIVIENALRHHGEADHPPVY